MRPIFTFLADLLLFISVTTLLFALAAYIAFKIRRRARRRRRMIKAPVGPRARVLKRYEPESTDETL